MARQQIQPTPIRRITLQASKEGSALDLKPLVLFRNVAFADKQLLVASVPASIESGLRGISATRKGSPHAKRPICPTINPACLCRTAWCDHRQTSDQHR